MGRIGLQIRRDETYSAARSATGRTLTEPRHADFPAGASDDVARQSTRACGATAGTARGRNTANATRSGGSALVRSAHAPTTGSRSAHGGSRHGISAHARASAAGCSATPGCVASQVARAVVPASGRAIESRATHVSIAARAVRAAAFACGTA